MGKQTIFYMDATTERAFIEFILSMNVTFVFQHDFQITEETELKAICEKRAFMSYLYHKDFGVINLMDSINIYNQPFQYFSTLDSAVVELYYSSVFLDDKRLRQGRIYVELSYLVDVGNKVQKSKALDNFYKKLVKWIKQNVPYQAFEMGGYLTKAYISNEIVDLIVTGRITRLS